MSWKFLKPTKWQIIIFLIILFVIPYISPCKHTAIFAMPEDLGKVSWFMCKSDSLLILMPGVYQSDTNIRMWGLFEQSKQTINLPIYVVIAYLISFVTNLIIIKFTKNKNVKSPHKK